MKKAIKIKNITLGEGTVKICVPIVATAISEIEKQCQNIIHLPCELVEIRMDYFLSWEENDMVKAFQIVRERLPDRLLLATFRRKEEGGEQSCSSTRYEQLYDKLIQEHLCDIIDLEFSQSKEILHRLQKKAHAAGIYVLLSYHDFLETKAYDELKHQIENMAKESVDIVKIAVMPHCPADVERLINVVKQIKECIKQPLIALAMGELGKRSRIECESFGSCVSFASAEKASAPGQLPCKEVRILLDEFHQMNIHRDL